MTTLGVMASQDLPFPGKRKLRGGIAGKEADAAQADYEGVRRRLTAASVDGAAATVALIPTNPDEAQPGDPVAVEVSIAFRQVSWLPAPWFLGNTNLKASSTMRRE